MVSLQTKLIRVGPAVLNPIMKASYLLQLARSSSAIFSQDALYSNKGIQLIKYDKLGCARFTCAFF